MEYEEGYYWVKYLGEISIAIYYSKELGWDLLEFRTPKNMEGVEILEKCTRKFRWINN